MAEEQEKPVSDTGGGIPLVSSAANVPTIFADGAWFAAYLQGVVRITLLENILEPSNSLTPGMKARHVGNLAMPRQAFDSMVSYLVDMKAYFHELDKEASANAKE